MIEDVSYICRYYDIDQIKVTHLISRLVELFPVYLTGSWVSYDDVVGRLEWTFEHRLPS